MLYGQPDSLAVIAEIAQDMFKASELEHSIQPRL